MKMALVISEAGCIVRGFFQRILAGSSQNGKLKVPGIHIWKTEAVDQVPEYCVQYVWILGEVMLTSGISVIMIISKIYKKGDISLPGRFNGKIEIGKVQCSVPGIYANQFFREEVKASEAAKGKTISICFKAEKK